ncbi:hypothetical protein AcV5_004626 [Taiwanofungus camphoratus]|nr:hypothetical protein AcV5_004626 [Antrodia cinnamomea]KAI0961723.1 hypothetical protein AcV7_000746 [Antrodia cinnamomea]
MAVPPDMTILNISGKYIQSKSLSDDTDEILRLQGVGWFTRKAIKISTLYLTIKHYIDDTSVEHIDIDQTLSGGMGGTIENRILDGIAREHPDDLFGPVVSRSRRIPVDEIDKEWLKEGWTEDTKERGAVHTVAESDTPKSKTTWIGEQAWGFEEVDGERRYVRHVDFTGPKGEKIQARLVYDYREYVLTFIDIALMFLSQRARWSDHSHRRSPRSEPTNAYSIHVQHRLRVQSSQ